VTVAFTDIVDLAFPTAGGLAATGPGSNSSGVAAARANADNICATRRERDYSERIRAKPVAFGIRSARMVCVRRCGFRLTSPGGRLMRLSPGGGRVVTIYDIKAAIAEG